MHGQGKHRVVISRPHGGISEGPNDLLPPLKLVAVPGQNDGEIGSSLPFQTVVPK